MHSRSREIVIASWVGIIGNSVLAFLKIFTGLISGSMAVLGDGIDSLTDIVTASITLFTARVIARPPDQRHPYGHGRAETITTTVLAFAIFFVGAEFALSTIGRIISGGESVPSLLALYVIILSVVVKLGLAFWELRAGARIESAMLKAYGRNMLSDVFLSVGVLIGLLFTFYFDLPIIDLVAALLISIWIMRTAVSIFMETNMELMEGVSDTAVYENIFRAVSAVEGVYNPHKARVRKIANLYIIDLDIEVSADISVAEAHNKALQVERMIKHRIDNVYDVLVHVEPRGNVEKEKFGVAGDIDAKKD